VPQFVTDIFVEVFSTVAVNFGYLFVTFAFPRTLKNFHFDVAEVFAGVLSKNAIGRFFGLAPREV
jgi:hypothetical protein